MSVDKVIGNKVAKIKVLTQEIITIKHKEEDYISLTASSGCV